MVARMQDTAPKPKKSIVSVTKHTTRCAPCCRGKTSSMASVQPQTVLMIAYQKDIKISLVSLPKT